MHIEGTVVTLRDAEKSAASVDRLPLELLAYIFQVLQLLLGWPQLPGRSGTTPKAAATWIRVTWVCRYWRCVALDCPTLWASIVDSGWWKNTTWLTTFLERSGETPLQVKLDDKDADLEAAVIAIRPLIHRVRRLELWTFDQPPSSVLAQFPGRFDVLKEAQLFCCYYDRLSGSRPVDDELCLSPSHFPSLRSLTLRDAHPAWETFSLTNLEVVIQLSATETGPSVAATLRLMKNSPHLRIFRTSYTELAPSLEPPHDAYGTILLARLEALELVGSPREVIYVLDRIIVPSTCTVNVKYIGDRHSGFLSPIRSIFPYQLAFQNLIPHYTALYLHFANHRIGLYGMHDDGDRWTYLEISGEPLTIGTIVTEDTWTTLLGAFASSPLTCTRIYCYLDWNISYPMWIALFERFPLHTLQASFQYAPSSGLPSLRNLFDALRAPCSSTVRLLELHYLDIDAALTDAIIDLLERRVAMNMPLDALRFCGCYVEEPLDPQEFKRRLAHYVTAMFERHPFPVQ
ncbi:hypothetical protein BD309DRAFT_999372 [Dichomitus squalens]|uniref:Uncharacterized protein n=1 Tax=Dichomitus squalens TaxID=114155 RepID=A0A4Q9PZR5_9APHY|nr:hypothetical protein BD309DRAFT_999372 [Dichomitus squalens]TBU60313.1 hypothetical protein BD310DRAFT_1037996 [Dichomitus squalens]